MTLPPIVERELRLAARRGGTYWGRAGIALAAAIIVWWVMLSRAFLGLSAQAGRNAFGVLAFGAALVAVGGALRLAAEAFAREKREQTLGFLLLTPQRPIDIVAGRLVSSSFCAFYLALAGLPALALPILVGGVAFTDFACLVVALVNALFLATALGLFVSARCWEEKQAAGWASMLLWLVAGIAPLAGLVMQSLGGPGPASSFLYSTTPAYAFWQAAMCLPKSSLFWWSVLVTQCAGWLLLWRTCRILPDCWQEKPPPLAQRLNQFNLRRRAPQALAAAAGRVALRRQRLDLNPVFWLSLRAPKPAGWLTSIVMMLIAAGVASWMAFTGRDWLHPALVLVSSFAVNAVLKNSVATAAADSLSTDRSDGAVDLLLATTQRAEDVVRGKWLALHKVFGGLARVVVAAEATWMALAAGLGTALDSVSARLIFGAGCLAMLIVLVADLRAIARVGLWSGVVERNARLAASYVQGRILLLPWILTAVLTVPVLFDSGTAGLIVGACSWFLISLAIDHGLGSRAWQRLHSDLSIWALRRVEGDEVYYEGWGRAGRALGQFWRRTFDPR